MISKIVSNVPLKMFVKLVKTQDLSYWIINVIKNSNVVLLSKTANTVSVHHKNVLSVKMGFN